MLGPVRRRKTTALFNLFDYDGDGFWEREDFDIFVERLADARGLAPDTPALRSLAGAYLQVWHALAAADADGDGKVTLDEALAYQEANFTPEAVIGFARVTFPVLDADGDGVIGKDEYGQYLAASRIDPSVAGDAFARLDTDGDGRLTSHEWEQLYLDYFLSEDPDAPGSGLFGPF